jgi:hypothetical protein
MAKTGHVSFTAAVSDPWEVHAPDVAPAQAPDAEHEDGPLVVCVARECGRKIAGWWPNEIGERHEFRLRDAMMICLSGDVIIETVLNDRDLALVAALKRGDFLAPY